MQQRIREIDYAKGIGIMLVMLGHSITLMDNSLNTFILSFHMPLFFFLSGMTINTTQSFTSFMYKKSKTIGCAIITSFLLYIFVGILVDVFWLKNESMMTFNYLYGLDNWFLIVLYITSIMAWKIILLKKGVIAIISAILSLTLFSVCNFGTTFLKYIEQLFLAFPFVVLGAYVGNYVLLFLKNRKIFVEIAITTITIICIISKFNGPCAMAGNIYGKSKCLFILSSILGIILVLSMSTSGWTSEFLCFCGRNSIIIFVTHFGVQKVIITAWRCLGVHNYMDYPYYFIMFFLLLIIEIPLSYFMDKKTPFLFGRKISK